MQLAGQLGVGGAPVPEVPPYRDHHQRRRLRRPARPGLVAAAHSAVMNACSLASPSGPGFSVKTCSNWSTISTSRAAPPHGRRPPAVAPRGVGGDRLPDGQMRLARLPDELLPDHHRVAAAEGRQGGSQLGKRIAWSG